MIASSVLWTAVDVVSAPATLVSLSLLHGAEVHTLTR